MNREEQQDWAKQYTPLIKKIAGQLASEVPPTSIIDREELEAFGWEGLLTAMKNYDEKRSTLTFRQYAGWSIRNTILSAISEYSRVIKVSYYLQQKLKEQGIPTFNTVSLNAVIQDDDIEQDRVSALGEDPDYESLVSPLEELLIAIRDEFNDEYVEMFCRIFGLDGHEIEKASDVAKSYNLSCSAITLRVQKMIRFIRSREDLMESLIKLFD